MPNVNHLAAFNPDALSGMLRGLPPGAVIFALKATGPMIALPRTGSDPVGQYVYEGNTISIVADGQTTIAFAMLIEIDGQPRLKWFEEGVRP
jgi:hypothetical protein